MAIFVIKKKKNPLFWYIFGISGHTIFHNHWSLSTLIWVGFLGVHFEVGRGGKTTSPLPHPPV